MKSERDDQPRHVAVVMDGNGRWAQKRKRPRTFGHQAGQKSLHRIVEHCARIGVGHHCHHPYACPFIHHCWGAAVGDARYPVPGLGGSKKHHGEWIARGYTDIRDVPGAEIDSEQQLRILIQKHIDTGKSEIDRLEGAGASASGNSSVCSTSDVAPAVPMSK